MHAADVHARDTPWTTAHIFQCLTFSLVLTLSGGCGSKTSATAQPTAASGTPRIIATVPADNDQCAASNEVITVNFSQEMNAASVAASFHVSNNAGAVSGTVAYAGLAATFTPTTSFAAQSSITASLDGTAADTQGNALSAPYTWTFTTLPAALTPGNYVVCWNPVNDVRLEHYHLYWDNKLPIDSVTPVGQATVTAHSYEIAPGLLGGIGATIYMAVRAQSSVGGATSTFSEPITIVVE